MKRSKVDVFFLYFGIILFLICCIGTIISYVNEKDKQWNHKYQNQARFIYVTDCIIEYKKDKFYPAAILADKRTGIKYLRYHQSITKIDE